MKNAGSNVQIEVDALRVGMFVHLDVGWMSHPFPLSSFRIASAEQIDVIRSLGLKKLRWSPEHSRIGDGPAEAACVPATVPVETLEAAEQRRRREALAAQRAALAACERQFAEATRECRQLTDLVVSHPVAARDRAHALSRSLVDKMIDSGELCIRLLTEPAGDRASAHAVNVTLISLLTGRTMGLGDIDMLDMSVGALLHDMGKRELPQRVRHREEHSSPAEARFYEEHVANGVAHALKMGLSAGASLVIAQHHEHADGSGFPLGIAGDRMSPASSIVALADRYDNLCNPPLPAKALTPHEALSLLFAQGRNRYDTAILNAFIRIMGVYPPGSVVQLTDDRYATVVAVNSTRPLKPRVIVCDPRPPQEEGLVVDLERHPALGIRRSLKPSQLPRETQAALSPPPRVAYFFEPVAGEAVA
jgi:putative nucleotidyltransferase with HDIG domain